MHLYLVRHAHAEDGADDDARPLSAKGFRQIRDVARRLRKTDAFDAKVFWHSPLVRSRDTARHFVEQLGAKMKLVEVDGLRHEDDPQIMARRLGDLRRPVAVVGHDPHLSALATLLVCDRPEPARFVLKKCAVLRLDRVNGGWCVRWQLSPETV